MLTQKQNQLLSFLIKRIEEDGVSPSYEEICVELSLKSKSGIHRIVKSLEERGYVERLENKARAIAPKKYTNGQAYITNVINLTNTFLDKKSINDISESIYNILYNEKLNLNLSKTRKPKLKKIIKPNSRIFEDISKRNIPVKRRRTKIIQQGTGIGTILLTLIPVLTSLLTKRK